MEVEVNLILNAHLNENSETIDEQIPKPTTTTARRYYTTSESFPGTTRIETRSQRARLPKTSSRSMFEEFSSRQIAGRGTGASFSTGTLDINLGRGRPTRGTVPPPVLFRPTASFDPSTYYPRPPSLCSITYMHMHQMHQQLLH